MESLIAAGKALVAAICTGNSPSRWRARKDGRFCYMKTYRQSSVAGFGCIELIPSCSGARRQAICDDNTKAVTTEKNLLSRHIKGSTCSWVVGRELFLLVYGCCCDGELPVCIL